MYDILEQNIKLALHDKIHPAIPPQSQSIVVKDKLAFLQKIFSIDPKAMYPKGAFIKDVLDLIEAAKDWRPILINIFQIRVNNKVIS
jgi:hypothetical protein